MSPTRLAGLQAMARQDTSPRERDIARAVLQAAGEGWDEPPKRPPAAPAYPMPSSWHTNSTNTASVGFNGTGAIFIRIHIG